MHVSLRRALRHSHCLAGPSYNREVDVWRELEEPWRASLELAWEAYRAGTVPVGAVVAGADGSVVARGRNRIFDPPGSGACVLLRLIENFWPRLPSW